MDELKLTVSTCTRNANAAAGKPSYTASNARTLQGWTRVRVTLGIERFPRDFELSYTETFPGAADIQVQEGDICKIEIGSDVVLSGFIDKRMLHMSAREHILAVSGRGACCDLVDCAAYWPGSQFVNRTIDDIARCLAGIYGVTVTVDPSANVGDPISQVVVIAGETVFSILDRLARFRALLLIEQADGSLLLSAVGTQSMASGFQEGVNVIDATTTFSRDSRFSDYLAVQQGLDVLKDIGNGGNQIAHVYDIGVQRLRYRMIVAEPVINGLDVAAQRATWEMNRRAARSLQIRVITDSWRDASGMLWQPNRLVTLNLPTLKIANLTWLISEVTFSLDENGTTAELTMMPPQGFLPGPFILNPVAPDITKVA